MYSPAINPPHQPWLDRVESLRDTILAHADATETNGTLAQPVVDALKDAGLFTLKVPKELGGAEADPMLQMAVIEALSYIHPATGWCAMIGNGSNGLAAGYLPDAGIATQSFRYGGGGALFQPNILELLLRDSNAAAQHIMVTDVTYEAYGKELMGLGDS
ncbi:MAG: acyl-CoA dehydrogenase family protein [Caldilineaceae bacterium]